MTQHHTAPDAATAPTGTADAPRIRSLSTRLIRVPLLRPWGPDVRSISLIETVVRDDEGAEGFGFSWTPSIGAHAAQALLDHDIAAFAVGRSSDPEVLWPELWRHLHEAGSGGLTTIAMAGLDLALWDLSARRTSSGLVETLGGQRSRPEVYGSGVNLHYSLDELMAQAGRWVDAGFDAVKMKVGSPRLADDVERVSAVRDTIGPGRRLMIDANQRWNIDQAERALDALAEFDLAWIEEPLRADDLPAHVLLRERTTVPIALGENVHTRYRFDEFLRAGVVDVVQPNAVRVGGITAFREIAALAESFGVQVAPHLLLELSGQLAATFDSPTLVESVEDASFDALGVLAAPAPVRVHGSTLVITEHDGLGIRFAAAPSATATGPAGPPDPSPSTTKRMPR
ncbi:mandelate racemase/muconate lactonizing enzyme family protein [Herbiconiux daphne]|uniref:Mandelate racemase/muconate lactonizing enzyme family protein n=1 Tax=Herbiconiux daphne TaxID=2970914 RepID=A0ABT2H341_9MICO|nr:mandelate racemase/muconate lactonizing enzyme family protein [Herbiconiux daphne]MCS5734340.1 mandelate racemase/muconate lactonizing enzyme family protein [Herbiconiux daphne]